MLLLGRLWQRRWFGCVAAEGQTSSLSIHIDGSCRGNNTKELSSRRGGIGIWFGEDHASNVSEEFTGPPPVTSNRAELWALIRTLQLITAPSHPDARPDTAISIRADSSYVILHAAHLWQGLRQAENSSTKDDTKEEEEEEESQRPANRDLWEQVEQLLATANKQQRCLDFSFVGRADNEGADKLAKDASDKQDLSSSPPAASCLN